MQKLPSCPGSFSLLAGTFYHMDHASPLPKLLHGASLMISITVLRPGLPERTLATPQGIMPIPHEQGFMDAGVV
jgi:hypothetical protein